MLYDINYDRSINMQVHSLLLLITYGQFFKLNMYGHCRVLCTQVYLRILQLINFRENVFRLTLHCVHVINNYKI